MHRRLAKSNREEYLKKVDTDPNLMVTADLIHGAKVARVSDEAAGTMIPGVDGLITDYENLFLSATAADCFLLYFYDPIKNVIGIAHAGWRGLLRGIVENSVAELVAHFDINQKNLVVGVAPGIRQCHFEISAKDYDKFREYQNFILEKDDKIYVSLPDIIKFKLKNVGVRDENIEDSRICTHCQVQEYFSYRRDKPKEVQVMMGYIGLI